MQVVDVYDVIGPESTRVVDRRKAKVIVTTYRQAVMYGASFTSNSLDGSIRDLL